MTMRPLTRVDPALPVAAMKTYEISAPVATHFRAASCAEVDCRHYLNGWQTMVDESSDLGQRQAYYIRKLAGRAFTEERNEGGLTIFTFEAGQTCFRVGDHRVSLGRPEIFRVWRGDWRGQLESAYRHTRPADWVDDFAEHQDRLARALGV